MLTGTQKTYNPIDNVSHIPAMSDAKMPTADKKEIDEVSWPWPQSTHQLRRFNSFAVRVNKDSFFVSSFITHSYFFMFAEAPSLYSTWTSSRHNAYTANRESVRNCIKSERKMYPVHLDLMTLFLLTLSVAAHIAAGLSASACTWRHSNSCQTILVIQSDADS